MGYPNFNSSFIMLYYCLVVGKVVGSHRQCNIKLNLNKDLRDIYGGGGGIRTHGRLSPTSVFKTGAFNHSATPPSLVIIETNFFFSIEKIFINSRHVSIVVDEQVFYFYS